MSLIAGNSSIEPAPRADPQSSPDTRGIALEQVGISRVRYPVVIAGWETDSAVQQRVEGVFDLTVSLAAESRGIHMSRLIETLHEWRQPLAPDSLQSFLGELRRKQGAASAEMSCAFTWFVNRPAPRTGRPAWQGIETIWQAAQSAMGGSGGYTLRIPVTTLCPCSRAISDYGAHSQRGWITVKIDWQDNASFVPPKEIFDKLQHAGSAPIYPLLKRSDERHVTMQAYEQPAFVEDTARRAALLLREDPRVPCFRIDARNEESIHTHDAIASVTAYSIPG
jgi:GTP cyclohydrolase I